MITYNSILQATEENARNFAQGYDFSQDDTEEVQRSIHYDDYIDTIKGIDIYYNSIADFYFFAHDKD